MRQLIAALRGHSRRQVWKRRRIGDRMEGRSVRATAADFHPQAGPALRAAQPAADPDARLSEQARLAERRISAAVRRIGK